MSDDKDVVKCRWPFPKQMESCSKKKKCCPREIKSCFICEKKCYSKEKLPLWWRVGHPTIMNFIGTVTKFFFKYCTKVSMHNEEKLQMLLDYRSEKRSLVTVANHYSCIDDPLMFGMCTYKQLNSGRFRWSLAAHDICFTNDLAAYFFGFGQVIPVVRGGGIYQKGVNTAIDKLNDGGWVHIFPEGKVNAEKDYVRYKWGVGRLINGCEHIPIVVPIFHVGMDDVLPNQRPYIPKCGQKLTILCGDPIDFTDLVIQLHKEGKAVSEIRHIITDRVEKVMENLKEEAHLLHDT